MNQSRSDLAQTEALIPLLEIDLRRANNRLCTLLGIPPEDLHKMLGTAEVPSAPPEAILGIPANLLRRRPDVRRAEFEAAAQSAAIGIAQSDLYPHIQINGTLAYSAEHFKNLFSSQAFNGNIGPSFSWDVLNYGRLINGVRAQDALFRQAVVRYQGLVLQANQEVEDGVVVYLRSQEQARFLGESVDAAQKALKLAVVQYSAGLVDFNRVALLQQNLVQQQDAWQGARSNVALGLIQVYRALGGGWQLRCTGCSPSSFARLGQPEGVGPAPQSVPDAEPAGPSAP
jgi:outer membrane protein TolC